MFIFCKDFFVKNSLSSYNFFNVCILLKPKFLFPVTLSTLQSTLHKLNEVLT